MVRAILTCVQCGRFSEPFPCCHCGSTVFVKTHTRRAVKGASGFPIEGFERWAIRDEFGDEELQFRDSGIPLWISSEADGTHREWGCKYGDPRDRLWVRETWVEDRIPGLPSDVNGTFHYRADQRPIITDSWNGQWKPSIHMPRRASRINLEICSIRVERVKSISREDAIAEGLGYLADKEPGILYKGIQIVRPHRFPEQNFAALWDGINMEKAPWQSNPWVWVVEIRRVA
jgi:hypothetical protein